MKKHQKHTMQYAIITAYIVLVIVFLFLLPSNDIKKFLVYSGVLFYILWGIAHHIMTKTISIKIVLEYLMLALIGILLLQIALFPYL